MKIGYARVSTEDQSVNLQIDALKQERCEKIFCDYASGAKTSRPEFDKMLGDLRSGDVVVIWKLDRLGRNLKHLVDLVSQFLEKNIGLKSLNDPIDTTHAQGRFVFNIFASLAEFERELIRERTIAGLNAAKLRGRRGGRKKGLSAEGDKLSYSVAAIYQEGQFSTREICERYKISRGTLYNYLRHRKVPIGPYIRKTIS